MYMVDNCWAEFQLNHMIGCLKKSILVRVTGTTPIIGSLLKQHAFRINFILSWQLTTFWQAILCTGTHGYGEAKTLRWAFKQIVCQWDKFMILLWFDISSVINLGQVGSNKYVIKFINYACVSNCRYQQTSFSYRRFTGKRKHGVCYGQFLLQG